MRKVTSFERRAAHRAIAAATVFGWCIASIASTQAAEANAAAAADANTEIVVTAQKRRDNLSTVPVPVSVLSGDTLVARNLTSIQDYYATAPGLNLNSDGGVQVNISVRGVTSSNGNNPAVGIVIDDVPFGSNSGIAYGGRLLPDLDPAELQQIEVLRGPQGTLYGAASIGGLVKFVTRDPSTDGASGRIQAEVNTVRKGDPGYALRASVNMPLSPTLAVRAGGYFREDGGYVDNLQSGEKNVNSRRVKGGRIALAWQPSELISVKLAAMGQNLESDGSGAVNSDYLLRPTLGDLNQRRAMGQDAATVRTRLYSGTIDVDLGFADLTSISGYGHNVYDGLVDFTPRFGALARNLFPGSVGATTVNYFRTNKFTEEVRLSSKGRHVFDWILGGFYQKENSFYRQQILAVDANNALVGRLLATPTDFSIQETAVFGNLTWNASDRFDIQFGGRLSRNRQKSLEIDSGPLSGGGILDGRSRDTVFNFLVTPRLRLSPAAMIYARVASGYRLGGPNPGAVFGFAPSYKPDTTVNYEIGAKGEIAGRLLRYDLSAYYIDWKDIQIVRSVNGFADFTNGSTAKSEGVELSLQSSPSRGLTIAATGAYNHAVLTAPLPIEAAFAPKGSRLPYSPRFSSSLSVDQDIDIDGATVFFGGSMTYVGDRLAEFRQSAANVRIRLPSYVSFDARIGVRRDNWTISLIGSNLGDRRGILGANYLSRPINTTARFSNSYIRPRMVTLSVARAF